MKTFLTRIDLADNRQVKQYENTETTFSGSLNTLQYTTLGQNYSDLKKGVDVNSMVVTNSTAGWTLFTFTGTTSATTYFGISSIYNSIIPNLPIITNSNYTNTFESYYFDSIENIIVDGNSFDITFSGSLLNFNVIPYTFSYLDVSGTTFSGLCSTFYIQTLSATTYEWFYLNNGSTTWLDVLGRANINKLTVGSIGVPSTSGSTGITGTITWDSNYLYVCVATNTWKRCQLSGW